MPNWPEYRSIAKEPGTFAIELYVVESNLATEPDGSDLTFGLKSSTPSIAMR